MGRINLCHYSTSATNDEVNDTTDDNINYDTHGNATVAIEDEDNKANNNNADSHIDDGANAVRNDDNEVPPITTMMLLPITMLVVLPMTMSRLLLISRLIVLPIIMLKMLLITTLLLLPFTILMEPPKNLMFKWLLGSGTFEIYH